MENSYIENVRVGCFDVLSMPNLSFHSL